MLAEALAFLKDNLKRNPTWAVAGREYRVAKDNTLDDLITPPKMDTLACNTLSGLVDAYKNKLGFDPATVAVHVVDPFTVRVVSRNSDEFGRRELFVNAWHQEKFSFKFNEYYLPEPFILAFRSSFLYNSEAINVLKLASTVTVSNSASIADDGLSQTVTVKVGQIQKEAVTLPAEGVPLIAHRTFREINASVAKYLFRMEGKDGVLPKFALFEIDHRWALNTMASIKLYLEEKLPKDAIIIA